ncbi:hypothetical protein [Bacillus sp. AFS015802]|uniref:hypothetical protein n=1 Tax=Bacillus sp. AFS015802 TaxID=2033486 RepID=UPI0015CF0268|nr:hypothetical protein [Bacillus sp. AFS015802]
MGVSHSHSEFDFYSLLLVLLIVAFLVLLAINPLAALIVGIAILVLLAVGSFI